MSVTIAAPEPHREEGAAALIATAVMGRLEGVGVLIATAVMGRKEGVGVLIATAVMWRDGSSRIGLAGRKGRMAMLAFGWIPLALALLMSSGGDDASKKESADFEGVWSFSRVEVDGAQQPAMAFPANKMIVLKDGRYVVVRGSRITHGLARLDPSTSPKHIDVKITDGPAKGRSIMAIYDLSGDTYKFCGSLNGKDRPAAFASSAGSGTMLQVMKREKQTPRDALVEVNRQELTGTWQATSFEREGTKANDEQLAGIQLVIDRDGNTKSLIGGKVFLAGPSTIDPTQDPMTLDITYTEGVNKGRTSLGIYKMEDGVLTICRRPPDKPRPTEFMTKPDSGTILIRYKREKSEPPK